MPQAARKDASSQRAQDKESKRARGALSCAECRRLKLKCDKTVPCSSCKRRGCSAICPNGSLITGQGTRFVLADTEKLHQKIAQMSDRIRQLEDALGILQSTTTTEPHPLLHRELLKIKSSIELHSAVEGEDGPLASVEEETEESQYIDAFGTLAIRDDGAATFYGRSAGSESLLIGETTTPSPPEPQHRRVDSPPSSGSQMSGAPWDNGYGHPPLATMSAAFPLAPPTPINPGIMPHLAAAYLPPWEEALRLCRLYLEQAPWFFGAVARSQLEDEILPVWYDEAPRPSVPSTGPLDSGLPPRSPPLLALLAIILCWGALTDQSLPPSPANEPALQYYHLTRAALALEPVLERPASVATIQALSLLAIYEGMAGGENALESTWALMGLAGKLAQSIGLHRDCARWRLPPAEVQKRRALFWEIFITDCWQSLATGRLSTFSLPFVDCELPADPDQTMSDDGTPQPSFPFWKARFGAECVAAVVQGTLTSRAPKYSIILALDRKVRDMEVPAYASGPTPIGVGLGQTMTHFMPGNYRELTLLYIHRCFFAHAISSHPQDPIKSQYAPSFLAGYRSACTIINSIKQQFHMFPAQIARFWVLWTHAFSAAVMLASVVTHSSQSKVAPAALLELRTACDLFEKAATFGGRAVKFLPVLQRLQSKAQKIFFETNSGIPPQNPKDIFKASTLEDHDQKDELSIFSGKTHTVNTKAVSPPSAATTSTRPSTSRSTQSGNAAGSSSRDSSGSPTPFQHQVPSTSSQSRSVYTDHPSFVDVHPSLVNELHGFEGNINAQIRNASQDGNGVLSKIMVEGLQRQQQDHLAYQRQQQQQRMETTEREHREAERREMERREQERQEIEMREAQRHEYERQQSEKQQHILQRQEQQSYAYERDQQLRPPQAYQHSQTQPHTYFSPPQEYDQKPAFDTLGRPYALAPPQNQHQSHAPPISPPAHVQQGQTPQVHHHHPGLSHSQSQPSLHHAYQQQQRQPLTQPQQLRQQQSQQTYPPPQYQSLPVQPQQPQQVSQQVFTHPSSRHDHHPSMEGISSLVVNQTPQHMQTTASGLGMTTAYQQPPVQQQRRNQSHPQIVPPPPQHSVPVAQQQQQQPQYWAPGPTTSFSHPDHPTPHFQHPHYPAASHMQGPSQHHHIYQPQQPQQYTPDGALRGIAAEDSSLQETWQSYMSKVGSPRLLFDD